MEAVRTHSFDGLDVLNMRISTWITRVTSSELQATGISIKQACTIDGSLFSAGDCSFYL